MIAFNFEGKRIEVPTKWNEVTVRHFCREKFLSGNAIGLLASLSGIAAIKLANTTKDFSKQFNKTVSFIKADPLGWRKGSTKEIEVLGVKCQIPKSLEMQMFGQKILFGQVLLSSKWQYDSIPEAVAIYLAPQIYPEDWHERIDEVAEAVKELPINKVWNMADFFLRSTLQLRRNGATY